MYVCMYIFFSGMKPIEQHTAIVTVSSYINFSSTETYVQCNSMLSENGTATGCLATDSVKTTSFLRQDRATWATWLHGWWRISPSLLTTSRVHCRGVPVAGSTAETINYNCKIIGTDSINAGSCYTEVLCHWEHAACCWWPVWHQPTISLSLCLCCVQTANLQCFCIHQLSNRWCHSMQGHGQLLQNCCLSKCTWLHGWYRT